MAADNANLKASGSQCQKKANEWVMHDHYYEELNGFVGPIKSNNTQHLNINMSKILNAA